MDEQRNTLSAATQCSQLAEVVNGLDGHIDAGHKSNNELRDKLRHFGGYCEPPSPERVEQCEPDSVLGRLRQQLEVLHEQDRFRGELVDTLASFV